jgi:apolipoprotein N-acyltransferase
MQGLLWHLILSFGWRRRLYAFAAGAVATLALAPWHFFPAAFLAFPALVFLLDAAATDPARGNLARFASGFSVGWWAGFGYFLAGLWWIGSALLVEADQFAWALPLAVIALPAALGAFWGAGLGAARLLWRDDATRIFSFAACLGAAEYARGEILTGFPWNAPGLAAMPTPPFMQSAAHAGIAGVTLLALFVFAAPAAIPARGANRRVVLALGAALAAGHAGSGHWRLAHLPAEPSDARVRVVQPAIAQERKWTAEFSEAVIGELLRHSGGEGTRELAGVDLLVWPESAFPFVLTERPDALAAIGSLLPPGAELATGALRVERPAAGETRSRVFNTVYLIGDNGEIRAASDKRHLVPFGEFLPLQALAERIGLSQLTHLNGGFEAGATRQPVATAKAGAMLALVCYEAIFPGEARGADRPDFLVNVTNDAWFGKTPGPYQHWHHARVAAVSLGLPLVRAANSGISAVSDPAGRVIATLELGKAGHIDAVLAKPAPATLYWRFGDAIFLSLVAAMLLAGIVCGKR